MQAALSLHRPGTPILIQRRVPGRIVNIWLILVVILGASISMADGLTRAPNPDLEFSPVQPLQYEPYHAAFLLAGITLPLMFAYSQRARISLSEGLFLWFTFCMTAYAKDFSYLRWPGVPLFVTDFVLVALLASVYAVQRRHRSRLSVALDICLALFIAAGVLAAARGLMDHREPVLILRDSALVVYPMFLLITYHLFRTWLAIKRVMVCFALGAAISVLNGLAWFVADPGQRRFVAPGVYVGISLVGILIMMTNRIMRSYPGWIFAGIFSLGVLLANARSLFVCLVIACLVMLFVPGMIQRELRSARTVAALLAAGVLLSLFGLVFIHSRSGQDFTNRTAENMASGLLHTRDDPFWQFRVMAWKEAWRRFQLCPSAGEGFGNPFNFEIWDNDPRPHNTFLTVLYKMGLVGFLPLLAILGHFFWRSLQAARHHLGSRCVHFLQILILAQISFCVWGAADALLESPYIASLFWAGIGLGLNMVQKLSSRGLLQGLLFSPDDTLARRAALSYAHANAPE